MTNPQKLLHGRAGKGACRSNGTAGHRAKTISTNAPLVAHLLDAAAAVAALSLIYSRILSSSKPFSTKRLNISRSLAWCKSCPCMDGVVVVDRTPAAAILSRKSSRIVSSNKFFGARARTSGCRSSSNPGARRSMPTSPHRIAARSQATMRLRSWTRSAPKRTKCHGPPMERSPVWPPPQSPLPRLRHRSRGASNRLKARRRRGSRRRRR
mmetsp:Transcript_5439/g.11009  ORF Transcript_5439/g.11009 Transcript_5439/m.11009 type:complete len:210 (-) Transcript_5439:281-910(-)